MKDFINNLEELIKTIGGIQMDENEKWEVEVTYKVKGKETYTDKQTWEDISPAKVGIMMKLLKEAQEKFIAEASSV